MLTANLQLILPQLTCQSEMLTECLLPCSAWPCCGTTPSCCRSSPWMDPILRRGSWRPKLFCRGSRWFTPTRRSSCSLEDAFRGWRFVQRAADRAWSEPSVRRVSSLCSLTCGAAHSPPARRVSCSHRQQLCSLSSVPHQQRFGLFPRRPGAGVRPEGDPARVSL